MAGNVPNPALCLPVKERIDKKPGRVFPSAQAGFSQVARPGVPRWPGRVFPGDQAGCFQVARPGVPKWFYIFYILLIP